MYTTHPPRAAARIFVAALFLVSSTSFATPIVVFDFDGPGGGFENAPELAAAGITINPWSDLDGTLTNFTGNPGRAVAARDWHDGNELGFAIQVLPGFALTLDGFAFDQRASSSGPLDWQLSIGGIPLTGGLTSLGFTSLAEPLSLSGLSGLIPVALFGSGASSASGTWRIDNFSLTGQLQTLSTPVPEPQSWLLLLGGLALLFSYRRLSELKRSR